MSISTRPLIAIGAALLLGSAASAQAQTSVDPNGQSTVQTTTTQKHTPDLGWLGLLGLIGLAGLRKRPERIVTARTGDAMGASTR